MSDKTIDTSNKTVFFITSNQSKFDDDINYSPYESKTINIKCILTKHINYKMEDFTINVLSFVIVPNKLREKDIDKNSKKYIAKIELQFKKTIFPGEVQFFKEVRGQNPDLTKNG